MKKTILLFVISLLFLVGCSMANTPTSKVETLFNKYQTLDTDINNGIENILDEQNLSEVHKNRYRDILKEQYKNLTYQIKEEIIDGNDATVVVQIEVTNFKKAINDLYFDSATYTKETFDEEKLNRLEKEKDKITYTLELKLTKKSDDEWELNALTNEDIKKIQGMY